MQDTRVVQGLQRLGLGVEDCTAGLDVAVIWATARGHPQVGRARPCHNKSSKVEVKVFTKQAVCVKGLRVCGGAVSGRTSASNLWRFCLDFCARAACALAYGTRVVWAHVS